MIISLIAAYAWDSSGRKVIGRKQAIPWNSPSDMRRFREITTGNPIIMGRKTHESIGRVLPKRENIIITGQRNYKVDGAYIFNSLDNALDFSKNLSPETFIIGGEEIYHQTLNRADRLYLTSINCPPINDGDAFFPLININEFRTILNTTDTNGDVFSVQQRVKINDVVISSPIDSLYSSWYN